MASGDPLPEGVVLWIRLLPEGSEEMPGGPVPVRWEVAHDREFRRVARQGTAVAEPGLAHSVHAEVDGLAPGRTYYYRFEAAGEVSPTGRTRTAPAPGSSPRGLRFAFASCQDWRGGRYPAYGAMAREEDLDLVVHLGDYIYEESGTRTLDDYRRLYARYKSAPELRETHASFPFVAVLDDHEVTNDWAGGASGERLEELRAAAFQAYYEHMPLRPSAMPRGPEMTLHRRLGFGDLVRFSVLDTRQHRTRGVEAGLIAPRRPEAGDPTRTMTGSAQERWLFDGLARPGWRWNVVAQQTMMAPYDYENGEGVRINHDQWDGYAAARDRLLDAIAERGPLNPVVISGDWHAAVVADLNRDPGDPDSETLATEFVGTSISSSCPWNGDAQAARGENPHVRFFDGSRRGYARCTVDGEAWRTDFRAVGEDGLATTLASWVVESGSPGARTA